MQAPWEQLFNLALEDSQGSELLRVVMERWCRSTGSAGAALYLDESDRLRRELVVGEGTFPILCESPELDGLITFHLPGGALVYGPAAGEEDPSDGIGPLSTLLALLTRISTLRRGIKAQRFEALQRGVEQAALYDVGLAITSTLNLDDLSEAILTWAISLLDARRAALYLLDDGHYVLARALGGEAEDEFSAADLGDDRLAELLPGASHTLAVPIETEGERRGFLVIADKESRHGVGPFGESDQGTLRLFANQAAIALDNARLHRQALEIERLEREMELAAEIQKQILPKGIPEVDGYELAGWNRPARQVGGDYYALDRSNGRLTLTVGDVSGKGMPASLLVSTLHSALGLMLDRHELGPDLVERLNRHVHASSASNKFITLIVTEIELESGLVRFVNAGHNPGIVIGADGEVRQLSPGGLPIGLMAAARYRSGSEELAPGDLLCLYSDGITECEEPGGEELGFDRLVELLEAHRETPIDDLLREIDRAVTEFAAGQPQGDDQTVVLLRRAV